MTKKKKKETKKGVAAATELERMKIVDQSKQNFRFEMFVWNGKTRKKTKILLEIGKDGSINVSLEDKMDVWKEYEEKLLNDENKRSGESNVERKKDLVKERLQKQVQKH